MLYLRVCINRSNFTTLTIVSLVYVQTDHDCEMLHTSRQSIGLDWFKVFETSKKCCRILRIFSNLPQLTSSLVISNRPFSIGSILVN